MPRVSVYVEACEVLEDLDDEDLQAEVAKREKRKAPTACAPETDEWLLQQVYDYYRLRSDAPRCLQEYIWRKLGKVI